MKKYTNSEIKARLVLLVGFALSLTFLMSVFMILYSLTFVVQPLEVSPNDQKGWETLSICDACTCWSIDRTPRKQWP
jgi:hypothetical protein